VLAHRPGHQLRRLKNIRFIEPTQGFRLTFLGVTNHLVSVPEIADMLGVSQQRAHQLIKAYSDFPLPEANLAIGRVWLRSTVETWAQAHPRRVGRPPAVGAKPSTLPRHG